MQDAKLIDMTAKITKSFLANHAVDHSEVGDMVTNIYQALATAQNPPPVVVAPEVRQKRKYTRRAKGEAVENEPIIDEQQAPKELADEVLDAKLDGPAGDEDDMWDEFGQPKQQTRPEPMFED